MRQIHRYRTRFFPSSCKEPTWSTHRLASSSLPVPTVFREALQGDDLATACAADLGADGCITLDDLTTLLANFGLRLAGT